MLPISSTYEILALKVLNRSVDNTWIDWAIKMLQSGHDTEHLLILAGEAPPYNQFELNSLTNKVLDELSLDYSDKDQTIKNYACYLIDEVFEGRRKAFTVLDILKDIYVEVGREGYLYDFYSLYYAKDDLIYSENQWYWDGADRTNIDTIILDYFKKWKAENKSSHYIG